ncbi:MAG TPA: transglycosylase domain-containing protein [Mobilitalea sp.]|nr:transglycosylase domain-containing protein [Mobilitalea sp.]
MDKNKKIAKNIVNKKVTSNKKDTRSKGQVIKLGLKLLLLLFLLTITVGIFYFYHNYGKTLLQMQSEAKKVVRASSPETFRAAQTSLVYDTEGGLISTLRAEKDLYYIEYEAIPVIAVEAIVSTEDKKFMQHDGVDYLANIRAGIALIKNKGEITQGASTITQQLARNIFLTNEVTYERKIREIFIAQELEKKYSKPDIMEYYFNNIYFANGHYGIMAAANGYFSTGINRLSLSQIVFLCAIPNNPTIYNPVKNIKKTLERRDRILLILLEDGKISQEEYIEALTEKIELKQPKDNKKDYVETFAYYSAIRALMAKEGFEFRNHFSDELDREAYRKQYDQMYYSYQQKLFVSGYRIYTSLDLKKQELLQSSVDQALSNFTDTNKEEIYALQGAAVCIDNDSGRVVAVVGGRSQEYSGYTLNRAYQSFRQPGSSIKPLIVYTPSFERGYYPESIVVDERFEGGPKNSTANYVGEMKLQRAIEVSKNTIAWKLFEELTPQIGLSYLLDMNFARIEANDYYPAASLGGFTIGVSPLEMASAFSALENDGEYRTPTCIVKIMDSEGNEIISDQVGSKQIYRVGAARTMTEALTGVMEKGTGEGLGLTNTISAGKTGTTDDRKDGWFIGYTPYYTTSVWVGYDMPKTLKDLKGSSYPGSIWHNYMEQIHSTSMTNTFLLYDWRADYQKEQEEAEKAAEIE